MRYGTTHDILTHLFYPNIPKKQIRELNYYIDNPNPIQKQLSLMLNNAYINNNQFKRISKVEQNKLRKNIEQNRKLNTFQLNMNNHRIANHSAIDLIHTYSKFGKIGLEIHTAHLIQDMISDQIIRNKSADHRDLVESSMRINLKRLGYRV